MAGPWLHRLLHAIGSTGLMARLTSPGVLRRLRYLPTVRSDPKPAVWPPFPWTDELPPVPDELRTVPGIWRDPDEEDRAFREQGPLPSWHQLHHEGALFMRQHMWRGLLPAAPRLMRSYQRLGEQRAARRAETTADESPERLTGAVRARAREIGLSAIGIARYDERYTFAPFQGRQLGDTVIVCLLEQDWADTQTIPSPRAEQAALRTYAAVMDGAAELARFLRERGFAATAHDPSGQAAAIHYAVESGLGQLGLNGQLLTPFAGPRCRFVLLNTDAPLTFDAPVDYGLHGVCDRCQACVRRCPVGAIPNQRREHRGITKAKIRTERCLPVVAQVDGCAICMKVCPVQRYGGAAVLAEFTRSGRILGRDTDELEGYDWPLDGRHYGPSEKPRAASDEDFLRPPGLVFDPERRTPTEEVLRRGTGTLGMDVAL